MHKAEIYIKKHLKAEQITLSRGGGGRVGDVVSQQWGSLPLPIGYVTRVRVLSVVLSSN